MAAGAAVVIEAVTFLLTSPRIYSICSSAPNHVTPFLRAQDIGQLFSMHV
jgi:hypothetical protein